MISTIKTLKGIEAVSGKADYLEDLDHPNHIGLTGIQSRYYGLPRYRDMTDSLIFLMEAQKVHEHKGPGRPREITAWDCMMSTPNGARLTPEEKIRIEKRFVAEMKNPVTKIAWHDHRNGTSDLHLIFLNRTPNGKAIKTMADAAMRRKFIAISDDLHTQINNARLQENRPWISTVKEARKRLKLERGIEPLEDLISRKAAHEGLSSWKDIQERTPSWIKEAGHEVTRNNGQFISIRYKDSSKPKRHRWANLQRDVLQSVKPEAPPKTKSLPSPSAPLTIAKPAEEAIDPAAQAFDQIWGNQLIEDEAEADTQLARDALTRDGRFFWDAWRTADLFFRVGHAAMAGDMGKLAFMGLAVSLKKLACSVDQHAVSEFVESLADGAAWASKLPDGEGLAEGSLRSLACRALWDGFALVTKMQPVIQVAVPPALEFLAAQTQIGQEKPSSASVSPEPLPLPADDPPPLKSDAQMAATGRFKILLELGHTPAQALYIIRREEQARLDGERFRREILAELHKEQAEKERGAKDAIAAQQTDKPLPRKKKRKRRPPGGGIPGEDPKR